MSSRSAAKKLSKPAKQQSAKPKAVAARGKPAKKPLAKVTTFPGKPPAKPQAAARPAAPPPPARPPLLGLRSSSLPPPARVAPPAARPSAPPARPSLAHPAAQAARPLPPARPGSGSPAPQPAPKAAPAPLGAPAAKRPPLGPPLRSGALQTTQPKQSLARSFYWSELRVGDDLPPLGKPAIDRVQIARYSAAANDFNRLHIDEPFAHGLGFPGTFAPGALAMGFVGQLLTAWLRRGHVRRLSARFVKIIWPGDELTCHGRIAELRKENGACYADVELWAENQKGELVLRGQATCELYESPGAGNADGAGLLFALDQGRGQPGGGKPQASRPPPHKTAPRPAAKPAPAPRKK